jgi:hypothetical protein
MALRRIDCLLVVEGYMDVVALAQAGLPNAVATLGTASGVAHFEKLFRARRRWCAASTATTPDARRRGRRSPSRCLR